MSATRDKSQKSTFVFTNLYQLHRKHQEPELKTEAGQAPVAPQAYSHGVLKTAELTAGAQFEAVKVNAFRAADFLGKRIEVKPAAPVIKADLKNPALESLKQNLKQLNDLHSRLRFMLTELEDLVKE